jgi:hypothetical protein
MPENYSHGARRNFKAGEHLYVNGHHEAAGYLFGIAAECAIKSILVLAGIPIGDVSTYRVHLPKLAVRVKTVGSGRAMRVFTKDPASYRFATWSIDNRYSEDGTTTMTQVTNWRADARELLRNAGIIL